MDREATATLQGELGPGEKLIWTGRPRQGLRLRATDALFVPLSLLWGGFAFYWESLALRDGPPFFVLWGIPFVVMGLYLIVGRFFVDAWRRSRTYYGFSNERVLIVSGSQSRQVTSLPLRTLDTISVDEKGDRSGTIRFGRVVGPHSWMAESGWPGTARSLPPTFDSIEDVRNVHSQLRRAQQDQIAPAAV